MIHFDLAVQNTGNATAYDIVVKINPPIENAASRTNKPTPLQNISVLKPAQQLRSYVSEFSKIKGKKFDISIEWRKLPLGPRETHTYQVDMSYLDGITRLGAEDPLMQIADVTKSLKDAWNPILTGSRRLKVDLYTSEDRTSERAELEQWHIEAEQEYAREAGSPAANKET